MDFDSTVMVREGVQEGTVKGYNPKRPGRNSHHPLIAFVSDIRMIAVYWLRPGNTAASTKHLSFLEDTLKNLSGKRGDPIRLDSGFFTKETLDYLEYIVAYRFTWPIKRELVGGKAWVDVADGIEMTETVFLAQSRTAPEKDCDGQAGNRKATSCGRQVGEAALPVRRPVGFRGIPL